jgi:uncharacterized membrane protein
MHTLYVLSVWTHVLAAITWIGGMFFLVLVVVPWLRGRDRATAATFLRETGTRFRNVAWTCFAVLLTTGIANLWMRGVRLENFADSEWLSSPFGHAVVCKLAVFVLALVISAVHDFVVGPRAALAVEQDPRSADAESLRRQASWLGRVNVLLALLLVALGVILVRGWPV